jgi:hypothetical protein
MAPYSDKDKLPVPDDRIAHPSSRASCPTHPTSNLCASCIVDIPELEEYVRCKAHSWHHNGEHLSYGTSYGAASLHSVPFRSSPLTQAKNLTRQGKQSYDYIHLPLVKQLQRLACDQSVAGHQIECLASMISPQGRAGHAASATYESGHYASAWPALEAVNITRSDTETSLAAKHQTAIQGSLCMRTAQCAGQRPSQDTKLSKWKPALVRPQTRCDGTWLYYQTHVARVFTHISFLRYSA